MTTTITAKENILKFIIAECAKDNPEITLVPDGAIPSDHWDWLIDEGFEDDLNDALNYEFRDSGEETDIPCDYSRHYESYTMARNLGDVSVAWTYWYGGGKHGDPGAVEWLDDAFFVTCEKAIKEVNVFTKIEANE